MPLESIPTDYVVLVSAALTALIVYQSRSNGLETEFERERHLNHRMKDTSHHTPRFTLTVDIVQVQEETGIWYRMKKWICNSMNGETTLVLRYERAGIPGDEWSSGGGAAFLDICSVEVEHLKTTDYTTPMIARFKIDSVDYDDVAEFPYLLAKYDNDNPGSIPLESY